MKTAVMNILLFCTPECGKAIDTYLEYRKRNGEILKPVIATTQLSLICEKTETHSVTLVIID